MSLTITVEIGGDMYLAQKNVAEETIKAIKEVWEKHGGAVHTPEFQIVNRKPLFVQDKQNFDFDIKDERVVLTGCIHVEDDRQASKRE